jgi:hypothetical protein
LILPPAFGITIDASTMPEYRSVTPKKLEGQPQAPRVAAWGAGRSKNPFGMIMSGRDTDGQLRGALSLGLWLWCGLGLRK